MTIHPGFTTPFWAGPIEILGTAGGHAQPLFEWKATLKLAGWTIPRSGDGLSAFSSSGDVITNAGSGASGMNNVTAWFDLRHPTGLIEFSIQMVTKATSSAHRVKVSRVGFTGGTPAAGQVGSATDEDVYLGSGTDASPTGATWFNTFGDTTSDEHVFLGGADSEAPYGFWFAGLISGTGQTKIAFMFDPTTSRVTGEVDPYILYLSGKSDTWTAADMSASSENFNGARAYSATAEALDHVGACGYRSGTSLVIPDGAAVSPHNAALDLAPILWGRPAAYAGTAVGVKGYSTIVRWLSGTDGNPDKETYRDVTNGDSDDHALVQLANCALPWKGTEINETAAGLFVHKDANLHQAPGAEGALPAVAPTVSNVSPTTATEMARTTPVTFDLGHAVGITFAVVWIKFKKDRKTTMVFDGTNFLEPFETDSIVSGPVTLRSFSIIPNGGWEDDIESLTVRTSEGLMDV